MTRSNLKMKGYISAYSFTSVCYQRELAQRLKEGTWRQKLIQRPRRSVAYYSPPYDLLSLLCYITQPRKTEAEDLCELEVSLVYY